MVLGSNSTKTLLVTAVLSILLPAAVLAQRSTSDASRDRPGDFVINRPAKLYSAPSADSRILREIKPNTVVHVVDVRDQWYKVRSQTGKQDGYIRRSYADPYGAGRAEHGQRFRIGIFKLTDPVVVRDQPDLNARKVTQLRAGAEVRVVDKQGAWYKVESETGRNPPGWIPTQAAQRLGDVETK